MLSVSLLLAHQQGPSIFGCLIRCDVGSSIASSFLFSLFRTHFISLGTIIDSCDTLRTLWNIVALTVFLVVCQLLSPCVCLGQCHTSPSHIPHVLIY